VSAGLRREFPDWSARLADDHLVGLGVLGEISDTALTSDTAIAFQQDGLPNTLSRAETCCFSPSPPLSVIAAGRGTLWAVCARPIIPATQTAATIP